MSVGAFGAGDDAVAFGGECGAARVGQVVSEGFVVRELEDLDFVGSVTPSGGPDSSDNGSGVFLNEPQDLVFVGCEVVAATFVRPAGCTSSARTPSLADVPRLSSPRSEWR